MARDTDTVTASSGNGNPGAAAASPEASPAVIRSQIEDTRAHIGETIDAIQDRLSPKRLLSGAKESLKDATVGRVKRIADDWRATDSGSDGTLSRAMTLARQHPVPAAVAGVALAAVAVRAMRSSRRRTPRSRSARGGQATRALIGACAGLALVAAWRMRQTSIDPEFESFDLDES
jgi:hypothetical protein